MPDDWIDRHSVTCVLCGGMADERETIKIQPDELEPPEVNENPNFNETVKAIADELGTGETHTTCFDLALEADDPTDPGLYK